jgi:5-methylcytosine-specific restriction enzyme subunit McrC
VKGRRLIRVFEYDRLKLGQVVGTVTFEPRDLKALQRIHADQDVYFDLIHRGVRFKNYVGVLHLSRLTIEILPKADNHPDASEEGKDGWRNLLIDMLRISGLSKVGSVSKAHQRLRNNTLLELYLRHFLDECDEVLRRGMVKTYRRQRGNVGALKGQLVFATHLRQNIVRRDRFFTEHQVYDHGHLANHVLHAALKVVNRIAVNSELRSTAHRLLMRFPEMPKAPPIQGSTFDKLGGGRKLEHYRDALGLAKLILLNFNPDLRRGEDDVLAILFDMNVLWERFIYRILQRGLAESGFKVSYQNAKRFWNTRLVKPDLVLTTPKGERVVIDTKWKLIRDGRPSDTDLKQMFVYNLYWKTDRSILLYPGAETWSGDWGRFYQGKPRPQIEDEDVYHYCKVATLRIWNLSSGHISMQSLLCESILNLAIRA